MSQTRSRTVVVTGVQLTLRYSAEWFEFARMDLTGACDATRTVRRTMLLLLFAECSEKNIYLS